MCNVQDNSVLNITMSTRLYARVSILVTCERQLDYVLAHKISLTPILLLKCLYQARKLSDQVFACLGISSFTPSTVLILFRQCGIFC
jgi:hypothetical protein